MRRLVVAGVLLALVLAGCETSQVDSTATVTVSGRLLRADGSPAAGVAVGFERAPDIGDVVGGLIIVPLTLFTACLADPPPAVCRSRDFRRATTGPDGSYAFTLRGDDTQSFFGNALTMSVSAELPPAAGEAAGAAVSARFKVQTERLTLPDLQMWQPRVTVAPGRIGWEPLNGATSHQAGVESVGDRSVWSFDTRGSAVTFDPRILEDTGGTVAVSTRSGATAEGTTVEVIRRSAQVGYRSAAGAPVSRGRPCTRVAVALTPCPLTDGDLTTSLSPPATTTTAPTGVGVVAPDDAVVVDLGGARGVTLVVVRGCSCGLDASVDGQAWTPLGRSSGFTAVVPPRTIQARYVRVTGVLRELREVSVWDRAAGAAATPAPATAPAPPPPATAPGTEAAAPPASPATEDASRQGPTLVALLALLAAFIATAAVATAARYRRPQPV